MPDHTALLRHTDENAGSNPATDGKRSSFTYVDDMSTDGTDFPYTMYMERSSHGRLSFLSASFYLGISCPVHSLNEFPHEPEKRRRLT
jgi:hypothetical protein